MGNRKKPMKILDIGTQNISNEILIGWNQQQSRYRKNFKLNSITRVFHTYAIWSRERKILIIKQTVICGTI